MLVRATGADYSAGDQTGAQGKIETAPVQADSNNEIIKVGPTFFLGPRKADGQGWYEQSMSWHMAYRTYLAVKNQPDGEAWGQLISDVKSLIFDDYRRIVGGVNMELKKDSGPLLLKSIKVAQGSIAPTSDVSQFLDSNSRYSNLWHQAKVNGLSKKGIDAATNLLAQLDNDYHYSFAFMPESSVIRSSPNEIILPLNAGPFKGSESQMQNGSKKFGARLPFTSKLSGSRIKKVSINWFLLMTQISGPELILTLKKFSFTRTIGTGPVGC